MIFVNDFEVKFCLKTNFECSGPVDKTQTEHLTDPSNNPVDHCHHHQHSNNSLLKWRIENMYFLFDKNHPLPISNVDLLLCSLEM